MAKPSALDTKQLIKVVKAALYVGGSAAVSYVIAEIAKNPDLFGVLTPVINVVAVAVKQLFTDAK